MPGIQIYRSRQGPQPLGTVMFEEIEAKAKRLKDYPGTADHDHNQEDRPTEHISICC